MLGDEPEDELSPLAALVAKSPRLQALLNEAARVDIEQYKQEQAETSANGLQMAERTVTRPAPHIYEPLGKRQTKRRQRRILFDRLRAGASREQACAAAGITLDVLDDWCEEPSFRESVLQATGFRHEEARDPYAPDFEW